MKIKRLYIGDFGVFKNQTLDNIEPGMVVIGGLNRAGKSTFLQMMRYLGYGISKSGKLPKPTVQYFLESDVISEDECKYNIRLQGYSEPKVTPLDDTRDISIKELYGNVDFYTYSQLYTITLDELQRVNSKEAEKLRIVMMGAGFKEIIQIPSIIADLKKEAEKIGGKNGDLSIKQFKPYNQKITESLKIKQDEKRKINLYYENIRELEVVEQNIINASKDFESWQNNLFLMDIIRSSLDKYQIKMKFEKEVEELKRYDIAKFNEVSKIYSIEGLETLRDRYNSAIEKYNEAVYYYQSNISEDLNTKFFLEKVKDKVFNYEKRLPEIKERLQRYISLREIYEEEKNKIISECNLVNEEFKGNLNSVLNIKCDDLSQDKLLMLSVKYNSLNNEIKQIDSEIEELNLRKTILEKQAEDIKLNNNGTFIKKYLFISIGITLIGILISLLNNTAGISISLLGIISTALYTVITYIAGNSNQAKNKELLNELKELNILCESKNSKLSSLDEEFDSVNKDINYYIEQLKLNEDISLEGLRDYLKNIQSLKKDIIVLSQRSKKVGIMQDEIINDFKTISEIVLSMQFLRGMEFESIIKNHNKENIRSISDNGYNFDNKYIEFRQYFLADVEKIIAGCRFLVNYEIILNEKQAIENLIESILSTEIEGDGLINKLNNFITEYKMFEKYKEVKEKLSTITSEVYQSFGTDKARSALKNYYSINSADEGIDVLINNIYHEKNSKEVLQRDYELAQLKVKEIQTSLDSEKDKRLSLKEEIKRLSTAAKLEKAQREIDKAKKELKSLAERYAVNKVAAYILEKVQESFLENAKDTLLKVASDLFKEITDSEYKSISPCEDLSAYDYAVTLEDDNIQSSIDCLSRGTAEQLFLSVRLSRINEIKPSLPIILDDPFVNFDSKHIYKVMKILAEFSKDNQIFILTCHPEIIENIMTRNLNVQYFKLDKGKFSSTDANNLIEFLSNK